MKEYNKYLAIGRTIWGKGDTIRQAKYNANTQVSHKRDKWVVYHITDDTFIDQFGFIHYLEDYPPIEVENTIE